MWKILIAVQQDLQQNFVHPHGHSYKSADPSEETNQSIVLLYEVSLTPKLQCDIEKLNLKSNCVHENALSCNLDAMN